jgi:hypothetical protein
MTGIRQRLASDMKMAMKAGEKDRVQVIRLLIAGLEERHHELGRADLSGDEEIAALRKAVKMRRDAIEEAERVGRHDVAARERFEIELIQEYLPQTLAGTALSERVRAFADEIGYRGSPDTGRFMKEWMSRFRGLADGRDVQDALKGLRE